MFTKKDCPACDWTEAYFDQLAQEFHGEDFQFAIMNVDENWPTPDLRQFLFREKEPMLQFLAVLPDGGHLKRFEKEKDSYEKIQEFLENIRYLVREQKAQAKSRYYQTHANESEEEDASESKTEL